MALVNRGRLSVQRVEEGTWKVIEQLAKKGGWDEATSTTPKGTARRKTEPKDGDAKTKSRTRVKDEDDKRGTKVDRGKQGDDDGTNTADNREKGSMGKGRKRKVSESDGIQAEPIAVRRSTRSRKS